jgi:FtsP/CotA-like multicopper oxidase with cupredoxin domain
MADDRKSSPSAYLVCIHGLQSNGLWLQLVGMAPVRATFLIVGAVTIGLFSPPSDPSIVVPNDNRVPAGVLKNDTLTVDLVVRMARWYPQAEDGPFVDVAAFAERGKEPRIPGPLIRAPAGTTIVARVTNELADSAIWVHGLASRPATSNDSTRIQPGQSRTFKFAAGKAGTYYYYATPGSVTRTPAREREQLSGALIVDEPGTRTDDRIMVINIWGETPAAGRYSNAVAINGKSWPYTERISANLGDSVHWRVINASVRNHPMHLHGFYFHLTSRGSILADTILRGDRREFVVTKHMVPGSTMSMSWYPNRPGNWLFHCHFTAHVDERARLGFIPASEHMHMGMDDGNPMKHMAGLVMGITVSDSAHRYRPERPILPLRKLRLYVDDRPAAPGRLLATSYILQRDSKPPASDSIERAGQPIVLTRNQPTRVTIINRAHAGTSIHWHGIELESYSDGVTGWSGVSPSLAPMIAPNDSFTANLILPRKGTFIYHTHVNDMEQLTSGAYGPIVVLDAGEVFDPTTDHTITIGWLGRGVPPNIKIALNGDSVPPPLILNRYLTHRFRFVNIGPGGRFLVTLQRDSTVMTWHPLAKDGFELTQFAQTPRPASQFVSVGETFDAEWKPVWKGDYVLTVVNGGKVYNRLKLIVR